MAAILVNGVQLFYKEQGSGFPILLIHGTAGNADLWGETFDALALHQHVIAYDRRGFSRSIAEPAQTLHQHGEDAAALLAALDTGAVTVVGWSAGGIVALDLALHHPELVSSVILYEPTLYLRKHLQPSFVKEFLKVQFFRWLKQERRANEQFLRFVLAYNTGGTAFDRLPVAWQQAMLDNTHASLAEIDAGTGEYLSPQQLSSISCPVTCLAGSLSLSFYHAACQRILHLLLQANMQVVEGAGHFVTFDQPTAFASAIQNAEISYSHK